ncbi:hypothetical protein BHM03_00013942 [Ensete ventricosum]|nr:hypothetical protein BHM03_00013942 [Ensete ventricosum]
MVTLSEGRFYFSLTHRHVSVAVSNVEKFPTQPRYPPSDAPSTRILTIHLPLVTPKPSLDASREPELPAQNPVPLPDFYCSLVEWAIELIGCWSRSRVWIRRGEKRWPPVSSPADGVVQEALLPEAAGSAVGDFGKSLWYILFPLT